MKQRNDSPIDFVIFWVDGSDPAWRAGFLEAKRREEGEGDDASPIRVRYWRNLHYWFRAVERFAPWVRRVHLVTWGHLPAWLATEHPKLHVVNHRDFIPAEYLPTYNSLTIGLNVHRIEGLAEQFVVFNDDMFLTRPCRPEDFFRGGLPCDMARLCVVQPSSIGHIIYNDLERINARWRKGDVLRAHPGKWIAPRYGLGHFLKNLTLLPWSFFPGILDHHMPQPYTRTHCDRCWGGVWHDDFDRACRHTFRNLSCVSDYLIRYDMLCRGEFAPRAMNDCGLLTLADQTIESICAGIAAQRWRMICLNDSEHITDFEAMADRLCAAFARILPQKSSYER